VIKDIITYMNRLIEGEAIMKEALNITAGIFGIVAAILWFLAAGRTPTPPQASYYDVVDSATSPFAKAWRKATWLNQAAAGMTGFSVLLSGFAGFL